MRDMTETVNAFIRDNGLQTDVLTRYVDLVSEIGELGKELVVSTDYGKREMAVSDEMKMEVGDCLFSMLALCHALDVDVVWALEAALDKYRQRKTQTGSISNQ